ncbi:unnamed protein product [Pleuronectes platessa]|uniref:Uncharacterized protein n=1 Tax=Pleuronectes platessa TaxID=8262 RepID=A0A9N7VFX5_PLEPL|nr:unnamed protein product [Pleuronectes platessa]
MTAEQDARNTSTKPSNVTDEAHSGGGTGREKCTQTLSGAAEPWRPGHCFPLLSSSLLSLCAYVRVYSPSPSASQLLSLGSSQEMNGSAQRTVGGFRRVRAPDPGTPDSVARPLPERSAEHRGASPFKGAGGGIILFI